MPRNPQPAKEAAAKAYNTFNLVTFTIPAKITNTITVTVQLKDARGNALQVPAVCTFYLSDVATGLAITGTATTSALAVATKGAMLEVEVTGKMARVVTNATGAFDINVIQTVSVTTYYMVVVLPDGSIVSSGAITF